jgi:dephospho-CoA kinase
MLLVGVTGNYGMGKSTVLRLFKNLGGIIIDADEIVDSLLGEKDVLEKIRRVLGETVFLKNGRLSKKRVAHIVFKNDSLRRSLEDILHPLVFRKINLLLNKKDFRDKLVFVETPLLFERGYERRFDMTITVYAEEEAALRRLEKEGISRRESQLRLKVQLPIEEKIKRPDFTVDNNGAIKETTSQVERIYRELLKKAKEDGNSTRARELKHELS